MDLQTRIVSGVTIAPPVIGRITMGHVELRGEKGVPKKDDFFRITSLVQNKDRSWDAHPIENEVRKLLGAREKLRAIPVRIAYDSPKLTLNNSFTAFDTKTGRVHCSGNGTRARRALESGVQEIDCPRPEACEYGVRNRCKSMTRVYLRIEGQQDELGVFVLRSTGHNTLNYLSARLTELHGLTQGQMAGLPLQLVLSAKSTTQSFREPVYFADLTTRPGQSLLDAVREMRAHQAAYAEAGLSFQGMEQQMLLGLANGDFADEVEDIDEWISDDALLDEATGNLARQGLRGLDAAVAQGHASGTSAAPAQTPSGVVTAEATATLERDMAGVSASAPATADEPRRVAPPAPERTPRRPAPAAAAPGMPPLPPAVRQSGVQRTTAAA